jgi:hypothetical protein
MFFVFDILLAVFIGYVLGGLVVFILPLFFVGYIIYWFGKPIIRGYIERRNRRQKLKKLLKERLKYLP